MEWFALSIPIIAAIVLKTLWHHKVTWWECVLPMFPVFIIIPLVKFSAEKVQVTDYERHGGWVVEAQYWEDWDEWITQTCSRTVSCGKDCTTTEYYDCSYRQYHPPYWVAIDSNGYQTYISSEEFEDLARKFNSRVKVDQHRHYYWKDGDMFSARWGGHVSNQQAIATEHWFENRVQNASGIYAYERPEKPKEKGLYDYPKLREPLRDSAILGHASRFAEADAALQLLNGQLGRMKQMRMWICLFHDKPLETGLWQEAHWRGGKKNEITLCIGLDGKEKVQWVHAFCWTPDGNTSNHELRADLRNALVGKQLDLPGVVKTLADKAREKFVRKRFREFSYLAVVTPPWAVWTIYILVALSTVGLSWYAIENEYHLRYDPFSRSLGLEESYNDTAEPGVRDWLQRMAKRGHKYPARETRPHPRRKRP